MPKELNFFDTNPVDLLHYAKTLGVLRKESPLWDSSFHTHRASKWAHHTERIVVVGIAIVVVRIEHACVRFVVVVASAFEERIARIHEVRVVTV